tara:strand:- start:27 stop:380 length:354 start_codon:yes stop_codon:yes gene_type:complete
MDADGAHVVLRPNRVRAEHFIASVDHESDASFAIVAERGFESSRLVLRITERVVWRLALGREPNVSRVDTVHQRVCSQAVSQVSVSELIRRLAVIGYAREALDALDPQSFRAHVQEP